ncbi:2-oxoacid:ferredoxin oxidoreductase subunit gamma [Deferribacterales bacterium RsTz2092]
MRKEIRLSGSGGQGVITAGIILARAASIYDNVNSIQSQSYGPEARGGASKAEVIISDSEINYPKVESPNLLMALTQEALDKYATDLQPDAVIIVDPLLVQNTPDKYKVYNIPVMDSAQSVFGSSLGANIISLGALNRIYNAVSDDALKRAVADSIPKAVEANIKALEVGRELAERVL